MSLPTASPRVDLPQAILDVLQELKDIPTSSIASIADIARATKLDRRTVAKAVNLILKVQDTLATKQMVKRREGKMWVIRLVSRTSNMIQSTKDKVLRRE
jgi:hypothetical protein